jgi:ArsR family transcriptional regulator
MTKATIKPKKAKAVSINGQEIVRWTKKEIEALSILFRTLISDVRLRILCVLTLDGEHTVTGLCNVLKLRQPDVSHHLKQFLVIGVVTNRREGKTNVYSVTSFGVDLFQQCDRLLKRYQKVAN